MTKNGRIESITGDVNLILGDGCTLNVKGLFVPPGKTLTIYGQSAGTGLLHSETGSGAAIGGYAGHDSGSIVIHGGRVEAFGGTNRAGIGTNDGQAGGAIVIYGGNITAKGGDDGAVGDDADRLRTGGPHPHPHPGRLHAGRGRVRRLHQGIRLRHRRQPGRGVLPEPQQLRVCERRTELNE